jgi:lipoate-protein ligase A
MANRQATAYPAATWRLIVDGEADGATNMAVDQAILNAVVEGVSRPTLRFYGWSPPCLSLGRSQAVADVDRVACRADGVDVVRRPTGGRAILHVDELTYSVALLQSDPRAEGGVVQGYRRLSEGLLAGLRALEVPVAQAMGDPAPANDGPSAVCFETPSSYEVVVEGRKLVGSAQWRARGGVLQHGTLPLHGDLGRILSYLSISGQERESQLHRLCLRALTLEEAAGRIIPFDEVARALAGGFAQALNLRFMPGELGPYERLLATDLQGKTYASSEWTGRV